MNDELLTMIERDELAHPLDNPATDEPAFVKSSDGDTEEEAKQKGTGG